MVRNDTHVPGSLTEGLVIQQLGEEVLVYNTATSAAHCLNREAAVVWQLCDGRRNVSDIALQFDKDGHGTVTSDYVWLALDQLNECGLIDALPVRSTVTSRRNAMKKVGLGLAIGLPLISSLVTPKSAFAVGTSCSCTVPGDCLAQTVCPSTTNCNGAHSCAP
jgi:hypothetical protein